MPLASVQAVKDGKARQHGAMEFSEAPVDLDRVRRYRLKRLREKMEKLDVAGLLLFNQINTRYAVDATNMQIWCSHYETRCVFVSLEGPVVLFDYSNHPYLAEGMPTIDEYRVLPAFYFFGAGDRGQKVVKEFAAQIADLLKNHGGGNRRLAIDSLSHIGCDALREKGLELVEGEQITETARAVKSKEELVLMQASMDVCEAGMRSMQAALQPGITENALWAKLHETNIRLGGEWIETRLLSSGPRTNPWFRECSMRQIEKGDLVSFDTDLIGPYGYCSDISRAWVCGEKPTDEQRRLYAKAFEQIEYNISVLKAGMTLREVSEKCWPIPDEFLSHRYSSLIHGVGLADEYPNIKHWVDYPKKGYDGLIEAGMVLCVESFIGTEGGREGVKLEEQVIVTKTGVERQSSYPFAIEII
ncbi:MAG: aminopeptidase P family protein [SAR324 cluster bacterium]|nr:aminopeptidase P family protein [SAR324 cluster bacterium]MBL7035316.1 aminopeptidase P family protein [SAR324 cluster bacterium]